MTGNKEGLQKEIEEVLLQNGASMVGFARMGDLASSSGSDLKGGISIAAALDPHIIRDIKEGPTREYYREYKRVNSLLSRLGDTAAGILGKYGFRALKLEPTEDITGSTHLCSSLPHKTVATRAGLGWIGKTALLVTGKFGSAVRLNSVLTDLDQAAGARPVDRSRCGECRTCVDKCPAAAASGRDWDIGKRRDDFFDAFKCRDTARQRSQKAGIDSTICGKCIIVCPFTKEYIRKSLDISS